MNNLRTLILSCLCLIVIMAQSCSNDDVTPSSADTLKFSTDTVSFGTVFTDLQSPTMQLRVLNKAKKNIVISSISLQNVSDERTHFYMNVDGRSGKEFSNVEIRGGDSIYIFVETKIDASADRMPTKHSARINFTTNGVTQQVVLATQAQNVTRLYNPVYDSDTRLTADLPYVIFDSITVGKDATLTIDPGTMLYFHDKSGMHIEGKIISNGTVDAPVTFRGDRLDDVIAKKASYDIMSAQWAGIRFAPASTGNVFNHTLVRNTSMGIIIENNPERDLSTPTLYLYNSVLRNSAANVITSRGAYIKAVGTEFTDASGSVVKIETGKINFAQCTIANYYLFSSTYQPNLFLDGEVEAEVTNSILAGKQSPLSPTSFTTDKVAFRNCLFEVNGSDDANFIQCIWNADPKFYTVREDYFFDYRLKDESDAIAKANPELCPEEAALDRYGVARRHDDSSVDVGAYVYVKQQNP